MKRLFSKNTVLTPRLLTLLGLPAVLGGVVLTPEAAFAQSDVPGKVAAPVRGGIRGTVVSEGSKPFTETLNDIIKRDAPYQKALRDGTRLPEPEAIPNVFGKELEKAILEKVERDVGAKPNSSLLVPYLGRIDAAGHFLPTLRKESRTDFGIETLRPGTLTPLAPPALAPQTLGAVTIDGLTRETTQRSVPPDTQGAVGPTQAMILVNSALAIYSKSTGAKISQTTLDSFFAVNSGGIRYPQGTSFDPRVVYDRRSERWYATNMDQGPNNSRDNNQIILAVSRTGDATGTWDKYVIPAGQVGFFTDYSTLGVDDRGVYFGATLFQNVQNGTVFSKIVATPLAPLIAASPSIGAITQLSNLSEPFGSPQPALNLDGSANGRAWFVYARGTDSGVLGYRTVTWSGTTPTFSANSNLPAPAFAGFTYTAPAAGSTLRVDNNDPRLLMAVIRDNKLWTARNVGVDANGGNTTYNRTAAEWLQWNVTNATATLTQSGRIFDNAASDPRFYYFPSISVSGQGHAVLSFSGSKSTEFVGIYTTGRLATDPLGTMQGILQIKPGNGSYTVTNNGPSNRWGDYSYTAVDPNDDQTIWTFQEYAANQNDWGIWGQQLKAPAPTAAALPSTFAGQGQQGQTDASFAINGTGFFDPGTATPAFLNRLTASLSGTGISNVRALFINPTTVGIQCNIAAGAPVGARTLTVTNPDGQTVTIPNAFNVTAASPPQVSVTNTMSRVGGVIRVVYTVTNPSGSSASISGIKITAASIKVGATTTNTTTPLPITVGTGTLAPGASAPVTVDIPSPGSAGTAARLTFAGTGSSGFFGSTQRIVLP